MIYSVIIWRSNVFLNYQVNLSIVSRITCRENSLKTNWTYRAWAFCARPTKKGPNPSSSAWHACTQQPCSYTVSWACTMLPLVRFNWRRIFLEFIRECETTSEKCPLRHARQHVPDLLIRQHVSSETWFRRRSSFLDQNGTSSLNRVGKEW